MATPLTDSINALTRYANETTGASDTTLSDAVETLIAGYGGGEKAVLLRTVILSTDSKEAIINFDNAWFNDYKFFVVKCHICYTASGSEWLYYLWNTKSYSGLYYSSPSETTAHFDTFFVLENTGSTVVFPKNNDAIRPQGAEYSILESGNYLCVKLYTNNYDEGAKFELYGIGKDTEQRYSVKDFIEKSNITGDIVYDEVNNRGVSLSFTNITSVKFTNVSRINNEYGTFSNCRMLKKIDFPKLTSLDNSQNTFMSCSSLKCVYFPVLKSGGNQIFAYCTELIAGVFPKLQNTPNNMFMSCMKFETLDIGETGNGYDSTIGNRVFNGVTTLKQLILRPSDRRVLLSSTKDWDTSVAMQPNGAGVDIYIPKVLYDCLGDGSNLDYLALPNWATVNGYGTITWKQIEGSQYEDRDWWKSLLEE